MSGYEVLAWIGGISGPTAAGLQGWAIWRDRPRLHLDVGFKTSISAPPRMWLSIYNSGSRSVTIREAGLYGSRFPVAGDSQDIGAVTATAFYTFIVASEAVLIDPGQERQFEAGVPDSPNFGYHVDFPLRVYALDARRRWIWGAAVPMVRMMLGRGPRPSFIDAAQWEPTTIELTPARVAPRWKLWVRRELRRGDEARPSYAELVNASRGG